MSNTLASMAFENDDDHPRILTLRGTEIRPREEKQERVTSIWRENNKEKFEKEKPELDSIQFLKKGQ